MSPQFRNGVDLYPEIIEFLPAGNRWNDPTASAFCPVMPRYFLHIRNAHGNAEDEEGIDASSLSEASEIAVTGIRDLLAAEAKNGAINLNGRVDISNEMGKVLVSIPFADALKITGGRRRD